MIFGQGYKSKTPSPADDPSWFAQHPGLTVALIIAAATLLVAVWAVRRFTRDPSG